jgi:hypothetical protein
MKNDGNGNISRVGGSFDAAEYDVYERRVAEADAAVRDAKGKQRDFVMSLSESDYAKYKASVLDNLEAVAHRKREAENLRGGR